MKNKDGFLEMYLPHVSILLHASKIYTNNLYKVFKKEYILMGKGVVKIFLAQVKPPMVQSIHMLCMRIAFRRSLGLWLGLIFQTITLFVAVKSTVRVVFFAATAYKFSMLIVCLKSLINIV